MKRTNLVVDEHLLEEAVRLSGERTYSRTVERALTDFVRFIESPLVRQRFLEAADLYRAARRAGHTLRSAADCLIAACALRHRLAVLHCGRDYALLTRVSALQARQIRIASGT